MTPHEFVDRLARSACLGTQYTVFENDHHFTIMFLAEPPDWNNDWAMQLNVSKLDINRALTMPCIEQDLIINTVRAVQAAWMRYAPEREAWRRAKHGCLR